MNITLFIGNGFDLNNELQTKFTDFYDHIKNIKTKNEIDSNDIYSYIEKDRDKWSYFEMQLGQLTFTYNEEKKDKLLEDINEFREDFIYYMIEQNSLFSFDEKEARQSMSVTLTEYMDQLDEIEKQDIKSVYKDNPSHIIFNFINFNYTDTLEKIVKQFDPQKPFKERVIKNTRYGYYLREIIPVHKQLETGMFLGVNDETQINSKIFTQNERMSLIKPLANEGFREDTNKKVENIIDKSNIVMIYGMSLGETDKKWWIHLAKWLKESESNRLIIYVQDSSFSKRQPINYFEKRTEYENRFLGFSYDLSDIGNEEIKEEIERLREKIYLIPNSKTDFKFSSSSKNMVGNQK